MSWFLTLNYDEAEDLIKFWNSSILCFNTHDCNTTTHFYTQNRLLCNCIMRGALNCTKYRRNTNSMATWADRMNSVSKFRYCFKMEQWYRILQWNRLKCDANKNVHRLSSMASTISRSHQNINGSLDSVTMACDAYHRIEVTGPD